MAHADTILRRFRALDRALQEKGFPATSPFWHETIERFYRSGRRQLVLRVGRRGGKSSTLCRLAVCEAIYGEHNVPPGDTGVVAIVSALKDDASERLETIRSYLEALGWTRGKPQSCGERQYIERNEEILIPSLRIAFRVYTASIRGVSGFTSIFVFLDECAKWRDEKTGANPAKVVIKSIRPTMATMRNARIILASSPMGLLDAHADEFARGDTRHQIVAHAPSWVANPTITEAQTHDDEPDHVDWEREYAAIPQAEAEHSLFTADHLKRATRKEPVDLPADERHRYVATIDPATRGNAWTLVVGCLSDNHVRRVVLVREWRGTKDRPLVPGKVFQEIRLLIAPYRLRVLYSDQFAEDSMREIARQHDLALIVDNPWTSASKADAYEALRTLFQEGRVDLPPDPQLVTDLLGVRQKLTRNGVVYELAKQGSRHSDYAPAVAMACLLVRVPPIPAPTSKTTAELAESQKSTFLKLREQDRKRVERRHGRPSRISRYP